jgi:ABC-2 type transport system permease protein
VGSQAQAILWAQFRTVRNYLPRTSAGTVLMWLLAVGWYSLFIGIATGIAASVPKIPSSELPRSISLMLFFVFLFWQIFPIMTLNSGWSLDLGRLVVYPIRERTLFSIEVLLRITTALETLILLSGIMVGLMRHSRVPAFHPLFLLMYLPFNLFVALAVRETLLRFFRRRKLKELFAVLFLLVVLSPTLIANTSLGLRLAPVVARISVNRGTPWAEVGSLSVTANSLSSAGLILLWTIAAYLCAVRQFASGLHRDLSGSYDGVRQQTPLSDRMITRPSELILTWMYSLFGDPIAALVEKEFRILLRSPRFRVLFGMACVFSVVVFLPFTSGHLASKTMAQNYLPAVSTYGLILLGEVLLWNSFGFDRNAMQLYFVAPVPFSAVLRAKNVVAILFILLMTVLVAFVGFLFQLRVTAVSLLASIALTLVMVLFFLAFGNLTSVLLPRPVDPNQALRRQNAGQVSLWFLLALVVIAVPVGLAYAARWAFDSDWAFFAVLSVDFVIAAIVYSVASESAIARAVRDRERILDALGKGADLIES